MNKMFKELEENMNDDPFFQPKTQRREEEEEEKLKEIMSKVELALLEIKLAYKNPKQNSKLEELFLNSFSKLHINKIYDEKYHGFFLLNENNVEMCFFDLRFYQFYVSYGYICALFEEEFQWDYHEIKQFIKSMINKYFKLNAFTLTMGLWVEQTGFNKHSVTNE